MNDQHREGSHREIKGYFTTKIQSFNYIYAKLQIKYFLFVSQKQFKIKGEKFVAHLERAHKCAKVHRLRNAGIELWTEKILP